MALTYFDVSQGKTFRQNEKKILSIASSKNFVFYAKGQVCLVICVGNRAQYRFRIKEVEWDRNCLKGLVFKNFEI